MVVNETGVAVLSSGSLSDWILVVATIFMAAATFLLYLTTRNQKDITEKLGKMQISFQDVFFNLNRCELELKEVISPLYDAICISEKENVENSLVNNNLSWKIGGTGGSNYYKSKWYTFWSGIEEYKYLCPTKTEMAISQFMNSLTTNNSKSSEYESAKENLFKEIKVRYKELRDERDSLLSKYSSYKGKIE